LGSGFKTNNGYVGVDPNGQRLTSVFELARTRGLKTGMVTNGEMTGATTAGLGGAHVIDRDDSSAISQGLFDVRHTLLLGGGQAYFRDNYTQWQNAGYKVIETYEELMAGNLQLPLLGLFGEEDLAPVIDQIYLDKKQPSVSEMAQVALNLLSNPQDKIGFLLLIEDDQIDTLGHNHDAAGVALQNIEFDKAARKAFEFARTATARGDRTLVLLTADHETGGLSLGTQFINRTSTVIGFFPEKLQGIKASVSKIVEELENGLSMGQAVAKYTDVILTSSERVSLTALYKKGEFDNDDEESIFYAALGSAISIRSLIAFGTIDHTEVDVGLYSNMDSVAGRSLIGIHDNTDIAHYIAAALNLPL